MGIHFSGVVENNNNYEPFEPGEYEVVMTCEKKLKSDQSDTYINCAFTVRKDVDQKNGGRMVFDEIYKSKATGEYLQKKIDGILSTIKDPKLDFEDYDELIQYMNGTDMIVEVIIEKAENENYKDRNRIRFLSYKPSKVSPADGKLKEVEKIQDEVTAADLPF